MAGCGRFPDGYTATAGESYWSVGDDRQLCFVLQIGSTSVSDYGADIGIDPAINRGDQITYVEPGDYTGLWTLPESSPEDAISRVIRNRRFIDAFPSIVDLAKPWLEEIATQTRRKVVWAGEEIVPGDVSALTRFSPEVREWLLEDCRRIQGMTPSGFERLVADVLRDINLMVYGVGDTHRKDGGVDIVAWPRSGVPYLLAVQIKHRGGSKKVDVRDVREFAGVLERNRSFRFGLLVTNSTFTDDAKEWQKDVQDILRLRNGADLKRWLAGDFASEAEWKEIPKVVSLGLGVSVPVKPIESRPDDEFWKAKKPLGPLRQLLKQLSQ